MSFIVAGTATDQLYGMLEALYRPDLSSDELFETMSQAFLSAVDRDAISGWGVVTYIMYILLAF
jgi:20S proteasome subunit beta 3